MIRLPFPIRERFYGSVSSSLPLPFGTDFRIYAMDTLLSVHPGITNLLAIVSMLKSTHPASITTALERAGRDFAVKCSSASLISLNSTTE